MILAHVFASLVGEPCCLRPWEIRRLTLRQVFGLYQWPRDKDGVLIFPQRDLGPSEDYESIFRRTWRMRKLPAHHIDRKWREHQERERGGHR